MNRSDLLCPCCRVDGMDAEFVKKLDTLETLHGHRFVVSSGYRCEKHNATVSTTGDNGPHTTGKAVDIVISGNAAWSLLQLVCWAGFHGIGISQRGPHEKRFIHIDDLDDGKGRPRPWVWSY